MEGLYPTLRVRVGRAQSPPLRHCEPTGPRFARTRWLAMTQEALALGHTMMYFTSLYMF